MNPDILQLSDALEHSLRRQFSRRQALKGIGGAGLIALATACGRDSRSTDITPIVTPTQASELGMPTEQVLSTITPESYNAEIPEWLSDFNKHSPMLNLAGLEFGDLSIQNPGQVDQDYVNPVESIKKYEVGNPYKAFRLPFRWERLQPDLEGELDENYLGELEEFLNAANKKDFKVILDMHNYFAIKDNGEEIQLHNIEEGNTKFVEVWKMIAENFKGHEALLAYGLMNEPHDTVGNWPDYAQAAIEGIREVDEETVILVSGDNWSAGHDWKHNSSDLHEKIKDPAQRIIFEAHQYFDKNNTGIYEEGVCISADEAIERINSFHEWLGISGEEGFYGELGIISNEECDQTWEAIITRLKETGIPFAVWAAGPWWGTYPLSVEQNGEVPQQTKIIQHVLK